MGRVEGFTVFVPGLLPGERATVRIVQVERRFARAVALQRIGSDAPERTSAECAVFGECGGCQLQHQSYPAQLAHKQRMVQNALARLAKLSDVPVLPTIGMESPWRYRNQVQVPLTWHEEAGRYSGGFFAASSHRVVETTACHLEPSSMEKAVEDVIDVLGTSLPAIGEMSSRGPVRAAGQPSTPPVHHVIVRESFTTGEQMVILVLSRTGLDVSEAVRRIAALPNVVSVALTVQPKPGGPVWGNAVDVVAGQSYLTERIGELEFLISPRSFFQVNTPQMRTLYQVALDYAQLSPTDTVLDAYCGTGTISLMLAKQAKAVVGIETISAAVEDARRNAAHNRIDHAEFVVGEVETVLPRWIEAGQTFDVAVLDPPRKGCDPHVISALIAARPRRIVYVSCNHVTLARDLRLLADGGYHVLEAQPVDMFPQTSHVEVVSSLALM